MQQGGLAETVPSAVACLARFARKTNPLVTGLVIGLGLAAGGAHAAPPAVDAVNSATADRPTTMTISHTTSGTDRLMLAAVSLDPGGNKSVLSVTYNAVPLVLVGTQQETSEVRIEIWQLVAPPTGTADLVVTYTAKLLEGAVVGVMTFTGVDQTTPLGTIAGNTGSNSTATVNVASATDELVFGVMDVEEAGIPTVGPGQTEYWNDAVPPKPYAAGGTEAGAATVTMSWSLPGADSWAIGGVSIRPAPIAAVISTAANQSFFVGDPVTAISQITLTDAGGTITAGNDIRIRMPAGVNMAWNSADATATIGGAASSKVVTTVGYEDGDATLLLNVTSNFAAGDVVTVSGLSFTSFNATSSAATLELEINNDNVVTALDDKTIQIGGPTYRSIGTDSSVLYSVGDASINSGTSVVTFGGGAILPSYVGPGDKLSIGAGSSTLFSDDFTDGVITGWTDVGIDSLSESGGVLRAGSSQSDSHYTVDAGGGWTDYTVTCDVRANDNDRTGISFRVQDGNNCYLLHQNFGNPGPGNWDLSLEKVVGGAATDLATPIDNVGAAAGQVDSEGVWYTLKVEVSGTSIKCYLDDVLKFDITDSTYAAGTVGVWCASQACWWDNMSVTGNPSAGGDFHILSRDSATQVTVQGTAGSTLTNQTYTIQRVYNTMQAWEDDRQGDLVTGSRREVGVCYNDTAFISPLLISGSTTDAANYMVLTVAAGQRHNGYKNTGAVIDAQDGWGNVHAIAVEDEYTHVEWLEIKAIHDTGSAVYFADAPAGDNGVVRGIFVHSFWQNNNAGVDIAAQNVTVRNSFFTGGSSTGIRFLANSTGVVENCTLYGSPGSGSGIGDAVGTTVSIKNTISVNHDAGWDFALYSNIVYFGNNMYSQLTGFDPNVYQGGNKLPPSITLEYLFIDTTTDDFHLESTGHKAGNTGLDLSGDFTDDIDGVTRVDTWDMGADEGVAGTDPLPPRILSWTEVEP